MTLQVYTGQVRACRGPAGLDIACNSSTHRGRVFAPTGPDMVRGMKEGEITQAACRYGHGDV